MIKLISSGKLMKAEEGLHFCNELIKLSNDAIFVIDPETGEVLYVNDMACDRLGYKKEELLSMRVTDIETNIPDLFSWKNHVDEVMKKGSLIVEGEHRRKDKTTFPVEVSIRYITYLNKDYLVAMIRDITEGKNAEEALKLSEKKYRTLVEAMPYGIQENDTAGILTFSNASHCKILGFTREEMQGKDICDFLTTEDERENLRALLRHLVKEQPAPTPFIAKNITKDGRLIDVQVDWNYKKDSKGEVTGFISVITDITELLKAEESSNKLQAQLLHSQKMEAIGRLAGGIAHDFGNILTAIKNFSSIGIKGTRIDDPYAAGIFEHINTAAFRAMNLTRQLLTFSRKDFTRIVNIDLNKIIKNLFEMLTHIIGEDITIVTEYSPELWTILGDSGKLEQVITNLVVNARDAMPGGGAIIIRTENIYIDEDNIMEIPDSRQGQFVRLTVEDTGIGISKQNINQIFEPFFTTKKNGSGSGLGLSVVYAIITDHGGWINVTSEEGVKTIFDVYFPALNIQAETYAEKKLTLKDQANKGERILLVEDDDIVRISTRMALVKEGYDVIDAKNSSVALRKFQDENGRFHMVISDLVLPDQNGLQLIKELLILNPSLKAILNSGYIDKQIDHSDIEKSGIFFLSKPYDVEDLLIAIRELMNQD